MSREAVFSFKEDRQIIAALDDLAEKQGTDRSSLIRQAVREFLEKRNRRQLVEGDD